MPNYKKLINETAKERISLLLNLSEEVLKNKNLSLERRKALSQKYSKLALEIRNHYKIKDKSVKKRTCKGCKAILVPGKTCSVIIASSTRQIIYKCKSCGAETKTHY